MTIRRSHRLRGLCQPSMAAMTCADVVAGCHRSRSDWPPLAVRFRGGRRPSAASPTIRRPAIRRHARRSPAIRTPVSMTQAMLTLRMRGVRSVTTNCSPSNSPRPVPCHQGALGLSPPLCSPSTGSGSPPPAPAAASRLDVTRFVIEGSCHASLSHGDQRWRSPSPRPALRAGSAARQLALTLTTVAAWSAHHWPRVTSVSPVRIAPTRHDLGAGVLIEAPLADGHAQPEDLVAGAMRIGSALGSVPVDLGRRATSAGGADRRVVAGTVELRDRRRQIGR